MSDPRFARLKSDPRFRRPKVKQTKVVIDDRFKSVFKQDKKKKCMWILSKSDILEVVDAVIQSSRTTG